MVGLTRRRLLLLTAGVAGGLAGCGAGPSGDETQTEMTASAADATATSQTPALTETATTTPGPTATTATRTVRERTTATSTAVPPSGAPSEPTATSTSEPPLTPTSTPTATLSEGTEVEAFRLAMISTLEENDIGVESFDLVDGVWRLSYTTVQTDREGLAREVAIIAGAYAGLVEEFDRDERLEATVRGADGSTLGTWRVEAAWARQYNAGEITERELLERVFRTVETA